MTAPVVRSPIVIRRMYSNRLVSLRSSQGHADAIGLGDLVACIPGFELLPEMTLAGLPTVHGSCFLQVPTAWQWAAAFQRRGQNNQYRALSGLLQWAEQQEAPA